MNVDNFDIKQLGKLTEKQLEDLLLEAKQRYYVEDDSPLTDEEYDLLEQLLAEINPDNRVLKMTEGDIKNKSHHPVKQLTERMGSLDKVTSVEDFDAWTRKQNPSNKKMVYQPKADGCSIQLTYNNGKLISAITRGKGFEGFEITSNVLKMKNVKKNIEELKDEPLTVIKAEIIIKNKDFDELLKVKSYENSRNAAGGISKGNDGEYCEYLTVLYHSITRNEFQVLPSEFESVMAELGLETVGTYPIGEIKHTYAKMTPIEQRGLYGYLIDGLVAKIDEAPIFKDKSPINYIAFKFPTEKGIGRIGSWIIRKSRTGKLTFVAEFAEPVRICGVSINHATLHSWKRINEIGTYPNAVCIVSRRNDVIPYIESVNIEAPTPLTLDDVKRMTDDNTLYIDGADIYSRKKDKTNILNEISWIFEVLEFKEVSTQSIISIIDYFKLEDSYEFFDCKFDTLYNVAGWGKERIATLKNQIKDKCGNGVDIKTFFRCLNIPLVGKERASEICNVLNVKTLSDLYKIKLNDLYKMDGIQETLANKIYNGIQEKKSYANELVKRVAIVKEKEKESESLKGVAFCMTGALSIQRDKLQKIIEAHSGKNASIGKANYLITNDAGSGSTKAKTAIAKGIPILSEKEFKEKFGLEY